MGAPLGDEPVIWMQRIPVTRQEPLAWMHFPNKHRDSSLCRHRGQGGENVELMRTGCIGTVLSFKGALKVQDFLTARSSSNPVFGDSS